MIDFPNNPTTGQQFTAVGVTWTWDGAKWLPSGLAPTVAPGINPSRIINGDMRVDQRNNGASGTAQGYTIDRWIVGIAQAGKLTWGRNLNNIGGPGWVGFPYYLGVQSSSAYAPISTDAFQLQQVLEGDAVSDFAWGGASAQLVTLSFWAYSSLTGTFSGCIANNGGTRSYPFTYSLPSANTWTKIVVTIPGDTGGTWVLVGSNAALSVRFDLGCGSNFRGPANAWASTIYVGATGSVSVVATNGATFYVTGVKLEIGSVATPFNRQSLAKSLADCQRYFEMSYDIGTVPGAIIANGATLWRCITADPFTTGTSFFKVAKRATPTVTIYSPNTGASGKIYAVNPSTDQPAYLPNGAGTTAFAAGINNSSVSSTSVTHHWTASAEL